MLTLLLKIGLGRREGAGISQTMVIRLVIIMTMILAEEATVVAGMAEGTGVIVRGK